MEDVGHQQPVYSTTAGLNVGPGVSAMASKLSEDIPLVESFLSWKAPTPLHYLGDITSLDGFIGGNMTGAQGISKIPWGFGLKTTLPVKDVLKLLGLSGAK